MNHHKAPLAHLHEGGPIHSIQRFTFMSRDTWQIKSLNKILSLYIHFQFSIFSLYCLFSPLTEMHNSSFTLKLMLTTFHLKKRH